MSRANWETVGVIASVAVVVVALHGITTRRWQTFHTVAVLASAAAYVVPRVGFGR